MAEMKALGVDVVRTNVIYYKTYKRPRQRTKPAGFNASNPNSPQYDWTRTDRLVDLAERERHQGADDRHRPGPYFASERPNSCRVATVHRCVPRPRTSASSSRRWPSATKGESTGTRSTTSPTWWSGSPRSSRRPGGGKVQTEAAIYRKLWRAGYASIARFDPDRRNRVLFGETAAIGEPLSAVPRRAVPRRAQQALQGRAGTQARLLGPSRQAEHRRLRGPSLQLRAGTARRGAA